LRRTTQLDKWRRGLFTKPGNTGFVGTINSMSDDDMKKCKYCGREIGKDTNFCWYCGRELEARPERPDVPQSGFKVDRRLRIAIGVALVVVILVILIAPLLRP
jgi:hypothetical protein